ncbi:MAG: VWA domain-containing protein [Proteobacteria bacterium]|nr:VWA domain-containing protein [Pseudomonadota bacterium]
MKTHLTGLALFAATVSAVAFYPTIQNDAGTKPLTDPVVVPAPATVAPIAKSRPQIELVFALDTTSSMGGFIEAAKEKIWSIASTMASGQPAPEIKIGLVAFRDRGDDYVTQVTDLSGDLDSVYAKLMDFKAEGGGDGPESVNEALYDAVHKVSWSTNTNAYKVIFLVGDAPPQMDYQNDVPFPKTLALARTKGIRVNTIQSGNESETARVWHRIADLSQGDFFNVADNGDGVKVATPFDENLAALSRELDATRLYFGNASDKAEQKLKQAATEKLHSLASLASRARRAAFNSSSSGDANFLGKNELVDAVNSGKLDLDTLDESELPSVLQAVAPELRQSVVKEKADKRAQLQAQIKDLSSRRDGFIAHELAASGAARGSLDDKLFSSIRAQAAEKGLIYDEAPKYKRAGVDGGARGVRGRLSRITKLALRVPTTRLQVRGSDLSS